MEQITDKLYSWASLVDEETLEQARRSAAMPFVDPHVALMPDAHQGIGATVGSVIPTVGAVMPATVGVDIGCGMVAVRTQFSEERLRGSGRRLAQLREQIERAVPLSPGQHNRMVSGAAAAAVARLEALAEDDGVRPAAFAKHWRRQLGSLGGGNHFIEISADEQGDVWVFLHSGSRGVGNRIARHFIETAKRRTSARPIALPHRDLAYLTDDDAAFHDYLAHLHWAQEFARLNREVMKEWVIDQLGRFMGAEVERVEEVNAHHNYTAREEHFGKQVLLSRKGAIDAHEGVPGLIPGSMGTASYVVTGKGNEMALRSAPHGAGRAYSRTKARRTFTQDDLRRRMSGIEYRDLPDFVDEIPDAYKDIDAVMADAADLVSVDHTLHQLLNVKGQ
ncbi:RtcB family protein [Georgenia sp. EYE_87]|uniref:RtcB family protein n=1 Tax=Georgenia sp. EYE_87 TaxID=2853448 RepID=UPI002002B92E|nr:RtcB family protein [Georgenia sp. EYE_87]MCK6211620.1 RtcB family protein [Georgenia sp. EYE_87]